MGNSHIVSLELLIKPRLKNSASSEENICEIYLVLLKSQTHPLHSWKKLVHIQANCSKIKQCIFKPHMLSEKHWCNTVFQWFWIPFLTHPLVWRKKENMSRSTVLKSLLWMSDAFSMNDRHEQEFKNKAVGWRLRGIRLWRNEVSPDISY